MKNIFLYGNSDLETMFVNLCNDLLHPALLKEELLKEQSSLLQAIFKYTYAKNDRHDEAIVRLIRALHKEKNDSAIEIILTYAYSKKENHQRLATLMEVIPEIEPWATPIREKYETKFNIPLENIFIVEPFEKNTSSKPSKRVRRRKSAMHNDDSNSNLVTSTEDSMTMSKRRPVSKISYNHTDDVANLTKRDEAAIGQFLQNTFQRYPLPHRFRFIQTVISRGTEKVQNIFYPEVLSLLKENDSDIVFSNKIKLYKNIMHAKEKFSSDENYVKLLLDFMENNLTDEVRVKHIIYLLLNCMTTSFKDIFDNQQINNNKLISLMNIVILNEEKIWDLEKTIAKFPISMIEGYPRYKKECEALIDDILRSFNQLTIANSEGVVFDTQDMEFESTVEPSLYDAGLFYPDTSTFDSAPPLLAFNNPSSSSYVNLMEILTGSISDSNENNSAFTDSQSITPETEEELSQTCNSSPAEEENDIFARANFSPSFSNFDKLPTSASSDDIDTENVMPNSTSLINFGIFNYQELVELLDIDDNHLYEEMINNIDMGSP
jgi:hypothetical protein